MKKYIKISDIILFGLSIVFLHSSIFSQSPNVLWTNTFGGSNVDVGKSVQQTSDGGFIVGGWTWSFGAGIRDFYLIKTDEKGDALWTKTYGGTNDDLGYSVQQTSDGGFIFAGDTRSFGVGNVDIYLIKTDESGNTLWTRTFGGSGDDFSRSVQQTSDGGYIIGGSTRSFGSGGTDIYLIKTDGGGSILWTNTFGGGDLDVSTSVQQTSDGGYIIIGYTRSFGAGSHDFYLVKTDANG